MPSITPTRLAVVVSVIAGAACAIIGWNSTRNLETLWDEAVDHDIAVQLAAHPITGGETTLDGSQMRLPMYVNAFAFRFTGRSDLAVARAVSLLAGAATIVAAGALARACFGPLVACLAATLLALSPYFISFARISMTEGDVFFALFVTLALWAIVRYLRAPTPRGWLLAGWMIALAIGAKLFAAFLIVVLGVMAAASSLHRGTQPEPAAGPRRAFHRALGVCALLAAMTLVVAYFSRNAAVVGWAATFIAWSWMTARLWRGRLALPGGAASWMGLSLYALVGCGAIMPVHLTDHQIAREVLRRLLRWDDSFPLALWDDHLRLYAGILMVKLTVPLGILTCAALVYAAIREREDGRWRACILSFVFYVVFICLLPLRQTFYLMGVYPAIMIVTAALMVEIGERLARRSRLPALAWAAAMAGLAVHLGVAAYRSYPWFHLHGYAQVGDRWLGAESRGYRNLIQTPSDGVESLIRWCSDGGRVKRGDRVVSFLWEKRIIDGVLPAEPHYIFVPRGITADMALPPAPPSITDADFVLVHINNLLGYGDLPPDWPPPDVLANNFEVVYTVTRGPLAVAWAYARKNYPMPAAP